jgi:predicted ATPase
VFLKNSTVGNDAVGESKAVLGLLTFNSNLKFSVQLPNEMNKKGSITGVQINWT